VFALFLFFLFFSFLSFFFDVFSSCSYLSSGCCDVVSVVLDAWQRGLLIVTLPWVVEYLSMAGTNPVDMCCQYFCDFWTLLLQIRR